MAFKIQAVELENYGNIPSFQCSDFSNINLIIGENATGKTFLLKALYSAIRSMEDYKRGDDVRSMNEILSEKLRWTFQVDKLGDIVNRSASESLRFKLETTMSKIFWNISFPKVPVQKLAVLLPRKHKKKAIRSLFRRKKCFHFFLLF